MVVGRIACPVCSKILDVPVRGETRPGSLVVIIDRAYLERHFLTHGPHPGMPLPLAA